ncbi:molybdate transport repressor [uncultured Campylobacter sp.]|uniref:molybdate transport repressor n=1 Tax=uncultured Campylobacter sp. TaxID=218934 RepID=UPI0025CDBA7C|nr:molybdate transport repressor [uncultured Campylobacter sp.]
MTVKENKKGAASALFLAIALFCAGFAGYFYYALGGTGIFTMAVAVICAVFCVKKIFQVSFLRIEDDGFFIQKGGKSAKFYFKDIKQISIREIDAKRKIDVLNVKFKKGGLDRKLAYGLMQPTGDDDAVIYDKYELSKNEIFKILKQKFEKQS